jgi:hypothetical protein
LSSILKALKKIEESSPPSSEPHTPLPNPIDTKRLIDSGNRYRRRRFFSIFLILLLLAGTTALLYSQRRMLASKVLSVLSPESPTADKASQMAGKASKSGNANVYKAKVPPSSVRSDQKPPSAARRTPNPTQKTLAKSVAKKPQAPPTSGIQRGIKQTPPAPPPRRKRAPQTAANSRVEKKPLQKASVSPIKKPAADRKSRPAASVARTKQPTPKKTRTTYRPLEGNKLKLQALAWSDNAARRMAVINDSIVHEGDSVDGYQIIKIREEDIIVKKSGKSWRLEFGLQQ